MTMKRKWINAPSSLDQYHDYSGLNVLLDIDSIRETKHGDVATVYFTHGATISMEIFRNRLADGWINLDTPGA